MGSWSSRDPYAQRRVHAIQMTTPTFKQ